MNTEAVVFRSANIGAGQHQQQYNESGSQFPSIFDVLAQETLNNSLERGIKELLRFLISWSPQKYRYTLLHINEIYTVVRLLLEGHYLYKYDGSFTENFYGMLRVPIRKHRFFGWRLRSLILLVVIPYILEKIKNRHNELIQSGQIQRENPWQKFFLRFYLHTRNLIMVTALLFHISYVFSLTNIQSPLLYLIGVNLQCVKPINLQDNNQRLGLISKIWDFTKLMPTMLLRLFSYGLFLVQFFEHYYSSDMATSSNDLLNFSDKVKMPPHPIEKISERHLLASELDVSKCPICKRLRNNDTVLSSSGYVFCYPCIYAFVNSEGHCPVTSIPSTTEQLIRIYMN